MNEEILRIQKMVAEGKVSAEESVELLESLGGVAPPQPQGGPCDPADFRPNRRRYRIALGLQCLLPPGPWCGT